jgi:hypothetical protein
MHKRGLIALVAVLFGIIAATAVAAGPVFNVVKPGEFDPGKSLLVSATWLQGIGCPTGANASSGPYTDPACATGDQMDKKNEGLLLAKTGPTANNASAFAQLQNVQGLTLTELGYDIRKPVSSADARGSHCGAGAPRFNIETTDGGFYFLGCNSPPSVDQTPGNGWVRLRWGVSTPLKAFNASTGALDNISGKTVKSLSIVFDEGQDTGPDNFGLAVLDNVDVNGTLVGQGATDASGR